MKGGYPMKLTLIFDMDGTIADLYKVENWLAKLRKFDPSPYTEATLMVQGVAEAIAKVRNAGAEVKVVSWLSKESNASYDKEVRKAKHEWLKAQGIEVDSVRCVPYGKQKAYYRNPDNINILFDDNAEVRESFEGFPMCFAIDPNAVDMVEVLEGLL